jgi:hypothetical protein
MKDIKIETFATWELQTGIFGTSSTPLILQIDVKNNTNTKFNITGICVSLKRDFILFGTSKDILYANKNENVAPNSKFTFKIDIYHLQSNYSADKKFTIKVFGKNKNYESEELSINHLQKLKASYF